MIQRIQSVYLLLAIICSVVLIFVPVMDIIYLGHSSFIQLIENNNSIVSNFIPLLVIWSIAILMLIIQLFSFKNRRKQLLVGKLVIIITFSFYLVLGSYFLFHKINFDSINIRFGLFIPLLNVIFLILANSKIKKDEELIRSIDRIR